MRKRTFLIIVLCIILAISGCGKASDTESDTTRNSVPVTEDIKVKPDSGKDNGDTVIAKGSEEGTTGTDDPKSFETYDFGDGGDPSYVPSPGEVEALRESKTELGKATLDMSEARTYTYGDASESPMGPSGMTDTTLPEAMSDEYYTDDDYIIPGDPDTYRYVEPAPGLLTGGEWNDNKNFTFLKNLISDGQSFSYADFFKNWNISIYRLAIRCTAPATDPAAAATANVSGSAILLGGVSVTVTGTSGETIWKGVTDHEGMAYAYYGLKDPKALPSTVEVEYNGIKKTQAVTKSDMYDTSVMTIVLDNYAAKDKSLDLMFMVDTTGSMGDEISYLQKELENVIKRVKEDTSNIPLRLSVNFYRDIEDEYVVRSYDFSTDIDSQLAYLNKEYATGGGDYEEAVELALANAVNDHDWNEKSIKLLFLVLDAPPHNKDEIKQSLLSTIEKASEMGIRIIPVASSGIDKDTEFLLRAFAMTTGGTYTFLTDDSGIGDSHIEPTVGDYKVEPVNNMIVRIIEEYLR